MSHYDGIFTQKDGKWNKKALFGFISRVITQSITLKFFAMVFYYSVRSGTSPGVMICITASSSSISAVIMYITTKERLSKI